MRTRWRATGAGLLLIAAACTSGPRPREYQLSGQVLAVQPQEGYITIRHGDIAGFMPGMTMPFPVRDRHLLDGRTPGDLVDATLMVSGADVWLSRITPKGRAPLPPAAEIPQRGLAPGDRVPDASFVDQNGRAFDLRTLDGHRAILSFIYTRCPLPDFCPAIDSRFAALQQRIRSTPALADVRLLSVTLDPTFDTPPVLRAHAALRRADPQVWTFVTGAPDALSAFGRQFGLAATRSGNAPADVEHNLRTVVLSPERRVVRIFTGSGWTAEEVLGALAGSTRS